MLSNFYVGLSGQLAIEKRLSTIAHNVANMNTAGFRAEGVSFDSVLSTAGDTLTNAADADVNFSTPGTGYISRREGERVKTDNPLDVAVTGDAWLALRSPTGVVYTHDGRLKMNAAGEVQSVNNYPVLDAGGSPLLLDPDAGPPTIAADGMMTQNGRQVGAIGLFSIDPSATLTRADNSAVIPSVAAQPILDFTASGVVQGFVENSNVNPVQEISKLIQIQHDLDAVTQSNQTADTTLQDAIKTLGTMS